MKKKILISLLILSLFVCTFGLIACGDGDASKNFDIVKVGDTYKITGVKDTQITEVVIPENVTSIGTKAFKDCEEIKSLTIHDDVTYIGEDAFEGCVNIETVKAPASAFSKIPTEKLKTVTVTGGIIDDYTFSDCRLLSSVTINNGVLGIGNGAFEECSALKSIVIPDTVLVIYDYAFQKCTI